ncbi:MAG: hypothetical protein Q4D47_02695 [Erysipelotrichaceae bacterium]|nr:hypothetical protein [Erysipelotrichaceae bacterium]
MKKLGILCLLVLMVMELTACDLSVKPQTKEEKKAEETKKKEERKDTKEQPKEKEDKEKSQKLEESLKLSGILSDKEAAKKLYKDYTGYVNRLTKEVPDYEAIFLNDVKELVEVPESQFYQTLYTKKAFGYGQMRERYPGIYKIYLIFESDAEREKYEKGEEGFIKQHILYINTITGKSFIDSGEFGIYALNDLEQVAFAADGMQEFMHVDLLLWVLKNKGIISNIYDYGSALDFEDESVLEEYEDSFPELGGGPDGVIFRYPIYDFLNKKAVGYYDFDLANRKIWNSHTGEIVYEDPLAKIKEKKITAENAAEETVRILHDLYYLENPEQYSYFAQADNLGDIFQREGFVITIRSKGKDAEVEPVIARYFITEDGRRVYLYDEASDTYYAIYGTALWYEN